MVARSQPTPPAGNGAWRRQRHRILFLDAYDSFTNNITSLLATLLDAEVFVLPIDSPLLDPAASPPERFAADLRHELSHYAAVVCGPGPGSPDHERDVGLMRHLWHLAEGEGLLPVLGICLGFQSLVTSSGGRIRRLRRGLHGMVRRIEHRGLSSSGGGGGGGGDGGSGEDDDGGGIFAGVGEFRATLYHSLCADVGQDTIPRGKWDRGRWEAVTPNLTPLAWVEEEREEDGEKERILMAVRHTQRPFWGLQYHPESVCTEAEGHRALVNWFREALRWNAEVGRQVDAGSDILAGKSTRPSLLSQVPEDFGAPEEENGEGGASGGYSSLWETFGQNHEYQYRKMSLPAGVEVPDVVELLQERSTEAIILDSANASTQPDNRAAADVRGRHSIIALDVAEALRLEHHVGDGFATARLPSVLGVPVNMTERIPLAGAESQGIWPLLAGFQDARRIDAAGGLPDLPFLGGFMGYITYEQGLSTIGVRFAEDRGHRRPDLCLAWVTKSIVIDHATGLMYVQQLRPARSGAAGNGASWIEGIVATLKGSHLWQHPSCDGLAGKAKERRTSVSEYAAGFRKQTHIAQPDAGEYEEKVRVCQEYIAAGDSYELCLTDQTTVTRPRSDGGYAAPSLRLGRESSTAIRDPHWRSNSKTAPLSSSFSSSPPLPGSWQLYRTLRKRQPAPFASYLRLGPATLVSSSPERFLQHDRAGLCSMRPMKGTVRRSEAVGTLADAERILHVPKEEAENLMIVDLVRHDMHGICGAGRVSVPELLAVEEYRSVFQMITVVEGQLPTTRATASSLPSAGARDQDQEQDRDQRYTGLDVLAASLPPGSMTGAPKKRSCEILQQIEGGRERSLYSGVVGYMDVTGRGDWSVTIRSMFRWDDEKEEESVGDGEEEAAAREVWHIGAGGAVTILSTPEGERDEMVIKLAGPLEIFSSRE